MRHAALITTIGVLFSLNSLAQHLDSTAGSAGLPHKGESLTSFCSRAADELTRRDDDFFYNLNVEQVIAFKNRRQLVLVNSEMQPIKKYRSALGKNPKGPKTCDGDKKTPEGFYSLTWKNSQSDYHLSLLINYPNAEDLKRSQKAGCKPGDEIFVHGLPEDPIKRFFARHPRDWTKGCIAVTDEEIEDIWDQVPVDTPITICP